MASAVTHDFNNDIAIIAGVTDLLLGDGVVAPTPAQERSYLQMIRRATDDATVLVARLRAFHRPQDDPRSLQTIDLASVVAEAVAASQTTLANRGEMGSDIRVSWDPSIPSLVLGDPRDLREAAVELIINAVEASPATKTVRIRHEYRPNEIRLIVQDDGEGMAEDVADRCFEPFFTTRHGHGRGMGLAVVYGTVRRHGGRVSIESRVREGSTVTISLPPAFAASASGSDRVAPTAIRPLHVLVVDDNASVRTVVEAFLSGDGHIVDIAVDTSEALAKIAAGDYNLILTDQSMPGRSGRDLAIAVKQVTPTLPVILMTGFDLELDQIDDAGSVDLILRKPLTLAALREALATIVLRGLK